MTRPNDFGFGDEAQILKDTARRLLRDRCPADVLHRLVAGAHAPTPGAAVAWDRGLWSEMVELGWTAVAVPEAAGGFGMSLAAIAGLAEELGRAAVPSPLPATLAATYFLAACDTEAARALLRRIAGGAAVTLACTGRRGGWTGADVRATTDGDRTVLDGEAWYVQDPRKCDILLVWAADGSLCAVDVTAPGVTVHPDAIIDLTRDQARVRFAGVAVAADQRIAGPGAGAKAWAAAEPAILVLLAADIVGAAEWQLQTTAEYARTRVQFERPIGFFQAVKHPLVDLMMMIDDARTLVYDAACSFDHEPAQADTHARMAKAAASDAASYASSRSVQLHGGIGFTWECFVHLYFKRQKHSEVLFGDGPYHRARLADALIGRIGADG